MNCSNCGKALSEEAKFCENCGAAIKKQTTPVAPKQNGNKKRRPIWLRIIVLAVAGFIGSQFAGHVVAPDLASGNKTSDYGSVVDYTLTNVPNTTPQACLEHTWIEATDTIPQRCIRCDLMLPMSRPRTGEVFEGKNKTRSSTLLLENESNLDCYVVLKNINAETVFSFYIRANESKHVPVPSGEFYLYLCQGTDWYGPEYYFDEGTEPQLDSDLMDFNTYWWTYTVS